MKSKKNRKFVIAGVLFAVALVVSSWTTAKVVAWVRDLPNRVVIDGDAIASSFGQAATESYHLALRDGDTNTRLRILNEQFAPLIREHDEAAAWILEEYGEDINALADSDDPAVSTAASDLITMLNGGGRLDQPSNGG